jgi:XTP/dITP diphosphohydrolase
MGLSSATLEKNWRLFSNWFISAFISSIFLRTNEIDEIKAEMTSRKQQLKAFDRLLNIMDELRSKCPWDKKQTLESLRPLTIEETYELADAILDQNLEEVKGELGDLLLHIVFYAKIGSESNDFDITSVLNGICEKLIQRHPHIYGDINVESEQEVKQNWENIKLKEGRR